MLFESNSKFYLNASKNQVSMAESLVVGGDAQAGTTHHSIQNGRMEQADEVVMTG
jgi:diphthamide biosynthesis methyltransferase